MKKKMILHTCGAYKWFFLIHICEGKKSGTFAGDKCFCFIHIGEKNDIAHLQAHKCFYFIHMGEKNGQ
jgi:hypothetical protein